jgi:CpeT/CpcT family (DUF1001)
LVALFAVAGCATAPPADPLAAHSQALVGPWSNAVQWGQADDALRRPPAPGHPYDWLDYQEALFFLVEAPALGAHVVYLEWRGDDGGISRQRLWVFRYDEQSRVRMDFYTFRAPEIFAGQGTAPGAFAALSPSQVIGYGPACALLVTPEGDDGGFVAEIPSDCRITARSGREMTLSAQIYLGGAALAYQEAGLLENGDFAFKVPGGPAYIFTRTP